MSTVVLLDLGWNVITTRDLKVITSGVSDPTVCVYDHFVSLSASQLRSGLTAICHTRDS